MTTQHTPERWIARGEYIETTEGEPRFRVMGSAPYNTPWLTLAASAPDLLAALRACLNALTDETGNVARREADAVLTARAAIELADGVLSVVGSVGPLGRRRAGDEMHRASDGKSYIIDGCGQCWDEMKAMFPEIAPLEDWHLNDMRAGTPEQTKAVEEWMAAGNRYDYAKACDILKERGLYIVQHDGRPYAYGSAWLREELPAEIVALAQTVGSEVPA